MSAHAEKIARCAHLLIKHSESRNPVSRRTNQKIILSKAQARTELEGYLERIKASDDVEKAFRDACQARSDCGSYRDAGDLGDFGRGQMQKPFEDATFALRVGDMSGVVDTDSGLHLVLRLPTLASARRGDGAPAAKKPRAETCRAAHLLLKTTRSRNPTSRRTGRPITLAPDAARAELEGYIAEIKAAPAPEKKFAALARARSDCSSYSADGDLGVFSRGQMQKPFEDASFGLGVGEFSNIVETDSGLHVILRIA